MLSLKSTIIVCLESLRPTLICPLLPHASGKNRKTVRRKTLAKRKTGEIGENIGVAFILQVVEDKIKIKKMKCVLK